MTGFRPKPKQYLLKFSDDEELAGLEVTMNSVSVAEYNKILRVTMAGAPDLDPEADVKVLRKQIAEAAKEAFDSNDWLLDLFAERLVEWNLEDEKGKPVPTTKASVMKQERTLIGRIIAGWQQGMVSVTPPLSKSSSNGETSEELSLGLDKSSESQPS